MEPMQKIILVTGATGLSGREIVRKLSAKGVTVRVLVRNIERAKSLSFDTLPNVKIYEGDMNKSETLAPALRGADKAMLISSSNAEMEIVQCNFIEAAKKFNLNHIVKLSGIIADINSPFRYARMHGEIERKLENSGISFTHVRAGEFMQSYFRQVPFILKQYSLLIPMENQRIASIDVSDVAEVAVRILTGSGHKGNVYPITGKDALTMDEVAEKFSTVLGRKIKYISITPEEAKRARLVAGMSQYTVDALDELFAERRKGKESKVYNTIQTVFGLRPTTFEEFIIRNLQVFKGELPVPDI
jgi:uncharacterized protein YbjT (DUF2867 family)